MLLILLIRIERASSVFFDGATGDDVVDAVSVHKGKADLLVCGEGVKAGDGEDAERDENEANENDCHKEDDCRLHYHLRDLVSDLDLLDLLV